MQTGQGLYGQAQGMGQGLQNQLMQTGQGIYGQAQSMGGGLQNQLSQTGQGLYGQAQSMGQGALQQGMALGGQLQQQGQNAFNQGQGMFGQAQSMGQGAFQQGMSLGNQLRQQGQNAFQQGFGMAQGFQGMIAYFAFSQIFPCPQHCIFPHLTFEERAANLKLKRVMWQTLIQGDIYLLVGCEKSWNTELSITKTSNYYKQRHNDKL